LGVAFGYDNGDIDTTFNQGNQDTDSYTIAPYFGALLTDTLSIDFTESDVYFWIKAINGNLAI